METEIIRALAVLGVPGTALGVFLLLLRSFNFRFSQISRRLSALIAILFLLIVGGVTTYALNRWAPQSASEPLHQSSGLRDPHILLERNGEIITAHDLLRSTTHDVIRIDANTHSLGVLAEYVWMKKNHPQGTFVSQALREFTPSGKSGTPRVVYFDIVTLKFPGGRQKEIYFDISSFFSSAGTTLVGQEGFIARKLQEIYGHQTPAPQ